MAVPEFCKLFGGHVNAVDQYPVMISTLKPAMARLKPVALMKAVFLKWRKRSCDHGSLTIPGEHIKRQALFVKIPDRNLTGGS